MTTEIKDGKINIKPIYNGEVKELETEFELPEENYGFDDVIFERPFGADVAAVGDAELHAQLLNVNVNRPRVAVIIEIPHKLDQLFSISHTHYRIANRQNHFSVFLFSLPKTSGVICIMQG